MLSVRSRSSVGFALCLLMLAARPAFSQNVQSITRHVHAGLVDGIGTNDFEPGYFELTLTLQASANPNNPSAPIAGILSSQLTDLAATSTIIPLSTVPGAFEHRWKITGNHADCRGALVCSGMMQMSGPPMGPPGGPPAPPQDQNFYVTVANVAIGPIPDPLSLPSQTKRIPMLQTDPGTTLPDSFPRYNTSGRALPLSVQCVWGRPGYPPVLQPGRLEFASLPTGLAIYRRVGEQWLKVQGPIEFTDPGSLEFQLHACETFNSNATLTATFRYLGSTVDPLPGIDHFSIYPLTVEVASLDPLFNPGWETMDLVYSINPPGETAPFLRLEVFRFGDDVTPIYVNDTLPRSGTNILYQWDGLTPNGYVIPADSDLTVKLTLAFDPALQAAAKKTAGKVNIEIDSIIVEVAPGNIDPADGTPDSDLIMNDPLRAFEVTAQVKLKPKAVNISKAARGAIQVDWGVEEVISTPAADTIDFVSGIHLWHLGKKGDDSRKFFAGNSECLGVGSTDEFKKSAFSLLSTDASNPAKFSKATILFSPSGVGGDQFKVTASAKNSKGTEVMKKSVLLTVYRLIRFKDKFFEMSHVDHISNGLKVDELKAMFTDAYVHVVIDYNLTTKKPIVTKLASAVSLDYYGLYKSNGSAAVNGNQLDWATESAKTLQETPSNQTWSDADLGDANAQTDVKNRATAWGTRIMENFTLSGTAWRNAAGVEGGVIGVKWVHPKLTDTNDTVTHEWDKTGVNRQWLTITYAGKTVEPDAGWANLAGATNRPAPGIPGFPTIVVCESSDPIELRRTLAHEIGHATRDWFKRRRFNPPTENGNSDHTPQFSSPRGLMEPRPDNTDQFNGDEIKILKGLLP